MQVGRALAKVHEAGLVHRDFKPENVLIDPSGKAWLTDFGVTCEIGSVKPAESVGAEVGAATLSDDVDVTCSRAEGPAGTLSYMAPEQFESAPATPAFDQFAASLRDVFSFCTFSGVRTIAAPPRSAARTRQPPRPEASPF